MSVTLPCRAGLPACCCRSPARGASAADVPQARLAQTGFDFGRVPSSTPIHHAFRISNAGAAPLRIERIALTPPLRLAALRAQIAPGADTALQISLDPAQLSGRFEGYVVLYTNDPAAPEITLSFSGGRDPAD